MGEIDTKPIDVQTALSFFDHTRNSPDREMEKEREFEKEVANYKVQLEAKDSAYKQALLQIDQHHKRTDEISTLLKNTDMEKQFYINELEEAKARINELELSLNQTAHQLLESGKAQQQLLHEKIEFSSQAEEIKRALEHEKLRTDELLSQISDMKKAAAEKEIELDSSTKGLLQANIQIECLKQQLETMRDLENQLKRANELRFSLEKDASDAIFELNRIKEELGLQEKKGLDQAAYIDLLETELKRLREDITRATKENFESNESFEKLRYELEQTKERENEACFEIALLKSELHKEKSKLAETEVNESKAQREKTALYNALQQMGVEAEETKKENRMLKESISKSADEANHTESKEAEKEERDLIVVSHERKSLIENDQELAYAKKDLEFAMSKIKELRIRAEQAMSRAEAAERSKAALEDQIKRKREINERRKAALKALREESVGSSSDNTAKHDVDAGNNKMHQPLGKMLNMKF